MSIPLTFTLTSGDDIAPLAEAIDAFAEGNALPMAMAMALNLVAEELTANSFGHGGATAATVALRTTPGGVEGEVTDDGRPFDITGRQDVDVDAPIEERSVGGLGIHLVREMTEALHYAREGERNVIRFLIKTKGTP